MSAGDESAIVVARLTGALERQAEELKSLRSQLGVGAPGTNGLLRPDDVALKLAKSRAWVYRNQHVLGGYRVGGQLRFEAAAIAAYLERCRGGERRPSPEGPLMEIRSSARAERPTRS